MKPAAPRRLLQAALILGLTIAYFSAGKLGLELALVHPQASAVWPPTAIALAALLLGGYRLWPGILLGAFLVNVTTGDFGPARTLAAAGIALGNTLEALLGAYGVRRFASGSGAFDRAPRVFAFSAAVMASTAVSAACGVASLSLAGLAQWDAAIWRHWWIGDTVGALVFTPFILLAAMDRSWRWGRGRLIEALVLLTAAVVLPLAAFTRILQPQPHVGLGFLCIPPLLWAAFRFGQREVAMTMLPISVIGIWGTLAHGLTAGALPLERVLLEFQIYMGVMSVMFLAVAAEVAHRRQYELTLERQTETLRQQARVVELAPLLVCDAGGRIIRWNAGAERLYGFAPPEAVGRISHELLQTHFPEPLEQIRAQLFREGSWQGELRQRTRAGQEVAVASLQLLHHDRQGAPATILEVNNDITELKRVEQERLKLAKIVETSGDAIISKTLEGVITSWNSGAERLYGYSAAEAIGRPVSMLFPPGRDAELPALMERLRKGEAIEQYETSRRRKDGGIIEVSLTISPLNSERGGLTGVSVVARDVTEGKRAERRFQQAVESAPSGMIMATQQGTIVLANRQTEKLFGYRREELIGQTVEILVPDRFRNHHPDHRRGFFSQPSARPMGTGRDLYGLRKDGTEFPIEIGLNPIETEEGTWVLSAIVDISERKRAEQALRETQERYELVVAGAEAAIWDWDVPHGRVTYSPRWKQLRGLADAEVSDREEEWSSRIHPDDIDRVMNAVRAHFEGRTAVFAEEYRVRHKDGSWVWIHDRGLAKRDAAGRVVRMAGSEADITARRQAEEALRESEERFRTLADSSPVLIWVNGLEGCEFVNRAYLDYLNVPAADIQGFDWAKFVHPEDRDAYLSAYLNAFAKRESFTAQCRLRRADGVYRWMKTIGLPRFGAAGELQGYVGSTFDISDIKEAEAALQEADRRKDEFLAILGHELRNPLAAISSGTTLLQSNPPAERRIWIEEMVARQVKQLRRLVDDLLDVARITRGKIELRKEPVVLQAALEASVAAVEDVIQLQQHQLSLSMPEEQLYLEADSARLEQMIVNLLTNAAKYTPEGGKIRLSAQREGGEIVIRCRDTGLGLSSEMLEAIFLPFMQFPSADQGRTGLGMGLTLVKSLAEMHGGSIEALSDGLGTGSEFVLRLPAGSQQEPRIAADAAQPASGDAASEPYRILVVDDNRDLAESLGIFLRGAGHEVLIAHDGATAIPMVAREQPDIVFLDIGLPGMDGFAVAGRLRAMPGLKRSRIAAISGHKTPQAAGGNSALFDAYFVKPLVHEDLLKFLRAVGVQGAPRQ